MYVDRVITGSYLNNTKYVNVDLAVMNQCSILDLILKSMTKLIASSNLK